MIASRDGEPLPAPRAVVVPNTGSHVDLVTRPYGEFLDDAYTWKNKSKLVGAILQLLELHFDLAIKMIEMRRAEPYTPPPSPHCFAHSLFDHEILDAPTVLIALINAPDAWRRLILTRLGTSTDIALSGPEQLVFRYWVIVTRSTGAYDTFSTSIDAPYTYEKAMQYSLDGWGSIFNIEPMPCSARDTVRASDLVTDGTLQASVRAAELSSESRQECAAAVQSAVAERVKKIHEQRVKKHAKRAQQKLLAKEEEEFVPPSPYASPHKRQ
jgi:hypothetical protein